MSEYAPDAIKALFAAIRQRVPQAVLSGIIGDAAHVYGYHRARAVLPGGDYSVQLPFDRLGDGWAASALDISLPADLMKVCTRRLLDAAKAGDKRLAGLREFCGTLDGASTYPWDVASNSSEGVGSWDDSHLWHIHLSIKREFANDATVLLPIAEVFAGQPAQEELPVKLSDFEDYDQFVKDVAAATAKQTWLREAFPTSFPGKSAAVVVAGVAKTVKADLEVDKADAAAERPAA